MPRVVLYTEGSDDIDCNRVRTLLDEKNVPFTSVLLAGDEERAALKSLCGKKRGPQLFINDVHIGGLRAVLKSEKSGTLSGLLEERATSDDQSYSPPQDDLCSNSSSSANDTPLKKGKPTKSEGSSSKGKAAKQKKHKKQQKKPKKPKKTKKPKQKTKAEEEVEEDGGDEEDSSMGKKDAKKEKKSKKKKRKKRNNDQSHSSSAESHQDESPEAPIETPQNDTSRSTIDDHSVDDGETSLITERAGEDRDDYGEEENALDHYESSNDDDGVDDEINASVNGSDDKSGNDQGSKTGHPEKESDGDVRVESTSDTDADKANVDTSNDDDGDDDDDDDDDIVKPKGFPELRKNSSFQKKHDLLLLYSTLDVLRGPDGIKLKNIGETKRTKRNCFKGFELIMWFMTRFGVEEPVASNLGRQLHQYRFIHHVSDKPYVAEDVNSIGLFRNDNKLYQFYADDKPYVLNVQRLWTGKPLAKNAMKRLTSCLSRLVEEYDGGGDDGTTKLAMSFTFVSYLEAASALQTIRLDDDSLRPHDLKAFFINVYNGMAMHIRSVDGHPSNAEERSAFFSSRYYCIGGHLFSLNDVKHGILRNNAIPSGTSAPLFSRHDPRLSYALSLDPRIHFALAYGSRCCPRTRAFHAPAIDMELNASTRTYLSLNTALVELGQDGGNPHNVLLVSRIFGWYQQDFAEGEDEMVVWMLQWLDGDTKVKVASIVGTYEGASYSVRYGEWDFTASRSASSQAPVLTDHLGVPVSSPVDDGCAAFKREACGDGGPLRRLTLAARNTHLNLYQEYFHQRPSTTNYVGWAHHEEEDSLDEASEHKSPVVISVALVVVQDKEGVGSRNADVEHGTSTSGEEEGPSITTTWSAATTVRKYRVLLRSVARDLHMVLAASSHQELFDSLETVRPGLGRARFTSCQDAALDADLLKYESTMLTKEMKFGLLLVRNDQTSEEEILGNTGEGSAFYQSFLEFIGDTVELKGWKGYRGGLDVSKNKTGTHSVYTTMKSYEMMFHVSTMIPLRSKSERSEQQIMRKRFISNDAVVVVFLEPNAPPFVPDCIDTKYTQVYVVVQPVSGSPRDATHPGPVKYMVAVSRREGVPDFGPVLPCKPLFDLNEEFRDFFFDKLINALKASFKSPSFARKISRAKKHTLTDFVRKYEK